MTLKSNVGVHQCQFLKWLALVTETGCHVSATLHFLGEYIAVRQFFWLVSWLISVLEWLKAECHSECKFKYEYKL